MHHRAQERPNTTESALLEALKTVREGGDIDDNGSAMSAMVSCVQYFPELNYVCTNYTDQEECKRGIKQQISTRPEAFIDEVLALLHNKDNPSRAVKGV